MERGISISEVSLIDSRKKPGKTGEIMKKQEIQYLMVTA
jgi:hypothetical protein